MTPLRTRLLALLEDALLQLIECDAPDAGLLRTVADASTVLQLLDQVEAGTLAVRVSREMGDGI